MSRQVVRNAITNWISSAQITTLNQVFNSFPKRINFQVNSFPGQNSRAACVVFIENETESRIAIGGVLSEIAKMFYEVVIAPEIDHEAASILQSKKNLRVLIAHFESDEKLQIKSISGGFLLQEQDLKTINKENRYHFF